jgi:hypothetical protein
MCKVLRYLTGEGKKGRGIWEPTVPNTSRFSSGCHEIHLLSAPSAGTQRKSHDCNQEHRIVVTKLLECTKAEVDLKAN